MKQTRFIAFCLTVSINTVFSVSDNKPATCVPKNILLSIAQIQTNADKGDIASFLALRYFFNKVQNPHYEMKDADIAKKVLKTYGLLDVPGQISTALYEIPSKL